MSVDLGFWESGDGSAEDLYEDAAEGIDHTFTASQRVLEFRADLLNRWPDLADSIEPPEFDHELEVPSDLSRYILVTMHASQGDRIPAMTGLALAHGLVGYDPQAGSAIGRLSAVATAVIPDRVACGWPRGLRRTVRGRPVRPHGR